MKRSLFLLLITCLLTVIFCCFYAVDAATYGDLTYEILNGEVTITDFSTSATSVTIPETIDGFPVTSIGYGFSFIKCDSLTSIVIPDSVTSIIYTAFASCDSLTSITVDSNNQYYSSDEYGILFDKNKTTLIQYPIGNTRQTYTIPRSVASVGDSAFFNCDSLTNVIIHDSVTSIGSGAFYNCDSLESIDIPDSVTNIGDSAFYGCDSLTSVVIGDSVTSIGNYAFSGCNNLTIYGYTDSYAEYYAEQNNIPFVALDGIAQYTHKFIDYDGTVLKEQTIDFGTVIVPPADPHRPATDKFTYTFTGWQGYTEGMTQTAETLTFTAQYRETVNRYTYKFVDFDGTILKEQTVDFGTVIVPPADPHRPATDKFTYTFTGWQGYTEGMTQTAETLTFTAQYEAQAIVIHGDVTGDGTLNLQDLLRLAKYFAGWDVEINEEASDVTGDGSVNRVDLLRLGKYFAGWDVTLG